MQRTLLIFKPYESILRFILDIQRIRGNSKDNFIAEYDREIRVH